MVSSLILVLGLIGGLVAMAAGLLNPAPERASITDSLESVVSESTAIADLYFTGPEISARVIADEVSTTPESASQVDLLSSLTLSQPNVEGAYIGYPDGSFLDVRRAADDRLQLKYIDIEDGTRSVTIEIVDRRGQVLERPSSEGDTFDPRVRPWYLGASSGEPHWTDPYVFFTSQDPGITHSRPVFDASGELIAVVGVDIALADLETFLDARKPSENGGAAVLNNAGEVIAGTSTVTANEVGRSTIDEWIGTTRRAPTNGRVETPHNVTFALREVSPESEFLFLVESRDEDFLNDVRTSRQGLATLATVLGAVSILLLAFGTVAILRYVRTLNQVASTDSLTGLQNRSSMHLAIADALASSANVALLTFDLDGFKAVNDQYGHQRGDEALVHTAERLREHAPDHATLARMGGDEFCVMLVDDENPDGATVSLVSAIGGPLSLGKHQIDLKLSAGYTESGPRGRDTDALLREADIALYQSKKKPGSWVTRYHESMTFPWAQHEQPDQAWEHSSAVGEG